MKKQCGITLIELLVTLSIIGILGAISYPAYTEHVWKSKRASAKARINEVAQKLEKYYIEKATYTSTLTDLGYASATLLSEQKEHTITVAAGVGGIATSYVITATPSKSDAKCGNLTLNELGKALPVDC